MILNAIRFIKVASKVATVAWAAKSGYDIYKKGKKVYEVYDKVSASASYGEFVKKYTEQYVHEQDRQKLQEFLASEKLTEHLVDGCMEEDMRDSIDLTDLDIRMD